MKTADLQRTKHYTTNYEKIFNGLLDIIPTDAQLIEPFVGGGDLLNLFPNYQWEKYDIDEAIECVHQDTLKRPPSYANKWVITNPPFLAKNHATDKSYFTQYDDLYKLFLHTIIGCEGGIVIVPGNLFCDEGSEKIRREFLSQYEVKRVNFFTMPVFETTSYSVCAFNFIRKFNIIQRPIFYINEEEQGHSFALEEEYGYQIGGQILSIIKQTPAVFFRLVAGRAAKNPTNIYLYAADTSKDKIRLEWHDEQYYGKSTDRMFATLDCNKPLSETRQLQLIEDVNRMLNDMREEYCNLLFTNYRDNNRKRVGFDFIYKLCSYVLNSYEDN